MLDWEKAGKEMFSSRNTEKEGEKKKHHALPDAGSINMLQSSKEYKIKHCRSK